MVLRLGSGSVVAGEGRHDGDGITPALWVALQSQVGNNRTN